MTVTDTTGMDQLGLALRAAWTGDCADWPHAALILARTIDRQQAAMQDLTTERDSLKAARADRVSLWSSVETLRRRLATAENRIARQDQVIARAVAVSDGKAGVHVGIIARRAARWILGGA